ncbi:phosphonate C-P lyase system protein PhnH [Halogeometricum borinquense]|uniref:Phosphonate C-P lyase system protein PhnH n=1 Tax=Halogeometricum borinquense TaxID=60847 RepID=A0A6C0UFM9_9EURY|nr:phosphonate C-P lyase system protein PhnH [Halogeometricum borinquense]QIB74262.1 phosphonate C-P lyase system protein PhnH [Halogeometricum borinquense]
MNSLDIDPVHDTQATFRALVDATSRPGTVEQIPTTSARDAIVSTLVDHEVSLYGGDETLRTALKRESRLDDAPFEEADVLVVDGHTDGRVIDAKRGTLKEPSEGATLIYEVDSVGGDAEAAEAGLTLTLSGPGIPGNRTVAVSGVPADEIAAINDAQSTYPRGVDVYLTAGKKVVSLPRSANVRVEAEVA